MCASYGLDPRAGDYENARLLYDRSVLDGIREWAEQNAAATVRPTGRLKRNVNPIIVDRGGEQLLELGWWGYLVDGKPSTWPSINTRDDGILQRPGRANTRALVPATEWFEYQKPDKTRYTLGMPGIFTIAAVTQQGFTEDGLEVSCYSIVTRPPAPQLAHVHDRMPLVLPPSFHAAWLDPQRRGDRDLVDEAIAASDALAADLTATRAA